MYKKLAISTVLFLMTMVAGGKVFCQEDMVMVDNQQFTSPQRSPARFEHDRHNEDAGLEECNICHHLFDDQGNLLEDESSEDTGCAECHGLRDSGRKPGLRKAFHRRCKDCHLLEQKGPVMCGECHPK